MQIPSASNERQRPPRLERHYEFAGYAERRDFPGRTPEHSEREGLYPELGFERDNVDLTLQTEDGQRTLNRRQHGFAVPQETTAGAGGAGLNQARHCSSVGARPRLKVLRNL